MESATETLPKTDKIIQVVDSTYTSPFTGDVYNQKGYEARCSTKLIATPDKNYFEALKMVPEGRRMSVLDEMSYLIEREKQLKAEGKNPREVLNDPLFKNQIKGNPYLWMHSHVALRVPKGYRPDKFEIDAQGRKYWPRIVVFGDKEVGETFIPEGNGGKIVEWNEALRIPAVTSDGSEPQHTTHFHFDPDEQEVAVQLDGDRYTDGHGRCLDLDADYGRSDSDSLAAFRLFQGSFDDILLPNVEYFVKDRESFEKGLQKGRTE